MLQVCAPRSKNFRSLLLVAACVLALAPGLALAAMGGQGVMSTYAGNGQIGFGGDNGLATNADMDNPSGLAAGNNGDLLIADTNNNCIRKVDATTGIITTVAGQGGLLTGGFSGDGQAATVARLNQPESVSVDYLGNIYIADTQNFRIRKVDSTGRISTIAGTGVNGINGDGGLAVNAAIGTPCTVALNYTAELLYVLDRVQARVRQIDLRTGIITTLAGSGAIGFQDGPALSAQFNFDLGGNYVAIDPLGNVFLADENNNRVRGINVASATVSTIAGIGAAGFAGDGGLASAATLNNPTDIAMDGGGNLWFMDEQNDRIRFIDLATAHIMTVVGTGQTGFAGDGGMANQATVNFSGKVNRTNTLTGGMIIDLNGNLYFSDINNNRVRKVANAATPTPVPGSPAAFAATGNGGGGTSVGGGYPHGTNPTGSFMGGVPCPGHSFANAPQASVAAPNQGPMPLPSFTKDVGGGTGPVIVTFDPKASYLPDSPNPNQIYLYQAVWQFGDGTAVMLVPPLPDPDKTKALASVAKTYCGNDVYNVGLRLDVYIQDATSGNQQSGPSAFSTDTVHVSTSNYAPTPVIAQVSSPAMNPPYGLDIDISKTFDEDGYIMWAAVDWGDPFVEAQDRYMVFASFNGARATPPFSPLQILHHDYKVQGNYQVTLSVIDNGRMLVGEKLSSVPAPSDPRAALAAFTDRQNTVSGLGSILALQKYMPILRQGTLAIQVAGQVVARSGTFTLDFRNARRDKLDVTLQSNVFPDVIANASVKLVLGAQPNVLTLPAFTTDRRGKYRDSASGLLFDFNVKKKMLRIKLDRVSLATVLNAQPVTVINGARYLPMYITFNGTDTFATTLRFVYNAKANAKGKGTKGVSFSNGQ